jgi:hypothetical protein
MTDYQTIPLEKLEVNCANDRHGELPSEEEAIEWLLINKTEKMGDLLQDISDRTYILEEPLVMKKANEDKYVVYDGNRRVSCLKLLKGMASNDIKNPLKNKIEALKNNQNTDLPNALECRVENDINIINDILELRHIPGNSGAGQLKWDGHEKENFLERTGKSHKINFALEINKLLIKEGYLNESDRIPLSTFNRLFSSNEMRRRSGFAVQNNELELSSDKKISLTAMTRVAKDMISGNKTLDDVWDNTKKTSYLDSLEKENLLPTATNRLKQSEPITQKKNKKTQKKPKSPVEQNILIPTNLTSPIQNKFFTGKFCQIFYELQNTLKFANHPISICVSFRVFIDILTKTYLSAHNIENKESLAKRMQTILKHLSINTKLPEHTILFINKLDDHNQYFSINSLHKVLHGDFQFSNNDLITYMNNLAPYIDELIKNVNELSND